MVKEYYCDSCDIKFKQNSHLTRHKLSKKTCS